MADFGDVFGQPAAPGGETRLKKKDTRQDRSLVPMRPSPVRADIKSIHNLDLFEKTNLNTQSTINDQRSTINNQRIPGSFSALYPVRAPERAQLLGIGTLAMTFKKKTKAFFVKQKIQVFEFLEKVAWGCFPLLVSQFLASGFGFRFISFGFWFLSSGFFCLRFLVSWFPFPWALVSWLSNPGSRLLVSLGFGFLAFWFLASGSSFLDSGFLFMVSMVPGSMVSALRRSSSDCERKKSFVSFLKVMAIVTWR